MPIHPAFCPHCKRDYEIITLSFNAPIDLTCEHCGQQAERRFGVPIAKTDALKGEVFGGDQFGHNEKSRKAALKAARMAGVNVNGKMYMHGLARFPNDPEAWVANRSEAKRKCELSNLTCEELGVKGEKIEPAKNVDVSPDLVDQELRDMVVSGKIDKRDKKKLREEVKERITPHYNKPGARSRPIIRKRPRKQ